MFDVNTLSVFIHNLHVLRPDTANATEPDMKAVPGAALIMDVQNHIPVMEVAQQKVLALRNNRLRQSATIRPAPKLLAVTSVITICWTYSTSQGSFPQSTLRAILEVRVGAKLCF